MRSLVFGLLLAPLAIGCTGLSLGENDPDNNLGTHLGDGEVAVDPTNETSYVLVSATPKDGETEEDLERTLFAVKAGETQSKKVLDLSFRTDPRMLFLDNGALSMSQDGDQEVLTLLDRDDFSVLEENRINTWYWGTRISGSKRWFAAADNAAPPWDIHVIDSHTLAPRVIPHGGDWLEAMFTNQGDRLLAIVFYEDVHRARILSWDMNVLEAQGFTELPTQEWSGADLDVSVEGVDPDLFFSFTWVGISPSDKYAVFPVRKADVADGTIDDYELLVLDLASHEVRTVDRAKGPVGFSPDGSTIVSYDEDQNGEQRLLLIDAETLEADPEDVAIDGDITYFVSHEGNYVVVASNLGGQSLVLYDMSTQKQTVMSGPGVGLTEFVARPGEDELWIVEPNQLYRADLINTIVDPIDTTFKPQHINILPKRDELVLTDDTRKTLHFFDPVSLEELRSATLDF
ncbi:MAG: hypothetical protein U0271_30370 [Polyangiaceae bacterium]